MDEIYEGVVLKGVGGFYTVRLGERMIACSARGRFRKDRITPYAGDRVRFTADGNDEGRLLEILPRRNFLTRPPLANLDKLFIVCALADPKPNTRILDKTAAAAELQGIEPVFVFTKTDLSAPDKLLSVYQKAGFRCYTAANGVCGEDIRRELAGCVSAFTGNSGVGKSTLLNAILPGLSQETGETSRKLGRGRHTTRRVELFEVDGGYVADTPGFSAMDMERYAPLTAQELPGGFREFAPYLGECRFTSCTHTVERGCAVLAAAKAGEIAPSRLESYIAMYNEIREVREWQLSKTKNV